MIQSIKERIENLLTSPGRELGRWARFVRFQIQLWRFCGRQLRALNVMAMSSALSFRTIFALIPALVMALLVLKSVVPLEEGRPILREWLEKAGVTEIVIVSEESMLEADDAGGGEPEKKILSAADEIEKLVRQVESKLTFRRLGPVGAVLLIWTALTLLTTMERSLNRIYGARQSRSLPRRVFLYWSVLTLGPIILMMASYLEKELSKAALGVPAIAWLLTGLGWIQPVLVGIVVLATIYKVMPNMTISYRSAIGGALIAMPLWLVAKWAFLIYVHKVGSSLYGAMGLIPLFLMWLNFSWTIFLFGAELSHTAANLSYMQSQELAEKITLTPADLLAGAVAVVRPYLAGAEPSRFEEIADKLNLPHESVHDLLDRLCAAKIVCRADDEGGDSFLPARTPDKIAVLEILNIEDSTRLAGKVQYEDDIHKIVDRIKTRTQKGLEQYTLSDLIHEVDNENPGH
ncbi:MAG: YihY/virulence factor BrkB family protein [Sedimentisphaerales bacterium]|nr:YihY/virulence factor BrkB family protein [Sedimentisphaerales bacterium]